MSSAHPVELQERIVRAHVDLDLGPQEIAELFGVARTSVRRYLAKYAAGSVATLRQAIYRAWRNVSVRDVRGWFRYCGYRAGQ